jgi:hypothetical protein
MRQQSMWKLDVGSIPVVLQYLHCQWVFAKALQTTTDILPLQFHTEALSSLLEDDSKFGFIIMDGALPVLFYSSCSPPTPYSLELIPCTHR